MRAEPGLKKEETPRAKECGLPHEENVIARKKLAPIHPGEILQEEFLKPMGISQYGVAAAIGVPPRRINEIVVFALAHKNQN